jgi:hypothetical protein
MAFALGAATPHQVSERYVGAYSSPIALGHSFPTHPFSKFISGTTLG